MQQPQTFDIARERPQIEQALEQAGFDIDPNDPHLVQAQRERASSTRVIVDGGGQMRYTRMQQTSPEQAQVRRAGNWSFQVTHAANATVTISYQLTDNDVRDFARLLAALDQA